jgi:hypothetical protein
MSTETQPQYQHLEARPGSNYRQLWLKGRRIRAEVFYQELYGPEPRTPEELARYYEILREVVLEALDYATLFDAELATDRARAGPRGR